MIPNTYRRLASEPEAIEHWACPQSLGVNGRCIGRRCAAFRFDPAHGEAQGYNLEWHLFQIGERRQIKLVAPEKLAEAQKRLDAFYAETPRKGYCGLGGRP